MYTLIIDLNTKLAAGYYNVGKLICLGFRMMSQSLWWRINWIKSTNNSTTKTKEGWTVLIIDVHRLSEPKECSCCRWSSWETTMWMPCSQYLVNKILKDQLSWALLWSDLSKILRKVWFGREHTKKSGLWWRNPMKKLVLLMRDLLCFVLLCVLSCWIKSFDVFAIVLFNVCCWN